MKIPKYYQPTHVKVKSKKEYSHRASSFKLYESPQWREYRVIFLNVNPKCYACGQKATVVDHVTPHKGDFKLFWKVDNYAPLCKSHHDTVTNLFDRKFTVGNLPTKKIEWFNGYRMMNDVTTKIKIVPFNEEISLWIAEQSEIK